MRSKYFLGVVFFGLLSLAIFGFRRQPGRRTQQDQESLINAVKVQLQPANSGRLLESYGKLPLNFEANHGQTAPNVRFLSRGSGYTLFLMSTEAVLAVRKTQNKTEGQRGFVGVASVLSASAPNYDLHKTKFVNKTSATLTMKLLGANPNAVISGMDELAGNANYFIGNNAKRWRTGIPTYARVKYRDIYPGVDLVFYGNQRQVEYDLIIAPGADPAAIKLAFEGAEKVRVNQAGDLRLSLGTGEICLRRPAAYQVVDENRKAVPSRYTIDGRHRVSFELANYDPATPLVIDPTLEYSTYLGGAGTDSGYAIAVDSAGNAYVTGETTSTNFPITPTAFERRRTSLEGDVFVTKLNSTGTALIYSTYLGGRGSSRGLGMAVDSSGEAYVTGMTDSANYPTTAGAFQSSYGGGTDAFVTKLNAYGSGSSFPRIWAAAVLITD